MELREMLERAAKRAGYNLRKDECGFVIDNDMGGDCFYWEPADCDACAFRLMVDCGIELTFDDTSVNASLWFVDAEGALDCLIYEEKYADHNNDKAAATRMAILRAAAGC